MKLLFFGSGEFGLPTLQGLRDNHHLAAVVTQPDRPAGRKQQLTPTPVGAWAAQQPGLPVFKFDNVNTPEAVARLADLHADASVVIAFGQKLSPAVIATMGRLAVNLHASLLPKYRGAAPINWAMIHGEKTTGVSVIALAQRMDAGDVYAERTLTIGQTETAGELHDRLARLGPDAVGQVLHQLEHGELAPQPQDETLASKAPKLSKADGTVDFNNDAHAVAARIHGLTPWPGCRVNWTCRATGKTAPLILHRVNPPEGGLPGALPGPLPAAAVPGEVLDDFSVQTASGVVRLLEVQAAGTKVMPVAAFARGHQLAAGDRLERL